MVFVSHMEKKALEILLVTLPTLGLSASVFIKIAAE